MERNCLPQSVDQPVRRVVRAVAARRCGIQNLQVRLDIINFGNLLNKNWGKQAFSDQNSTCGQICSATVVLTQTGNKLPGTLTSSQEATGVYTFDRSTSCSTPTSRGRTTRCSCRFATASSPTAGTKRRARVIPGPSSFCSTGAPNDGTRIWNGDLTEGAGYYPVWTWGCSGRGAEKPLTDPRKWHTIRAQSKLVVICRLLPPR